MIVAYYLDNYLKRAVDVAEELSKGTLPVFDTNKYCRYFEDGNRLDFESVYFERRKNLTMFGLVSVLWQDIDERGLVSEGKRLEYAGRLLNIIEDVLREPTWVLPAHGSIEHLEGKRVSIDLFAAETAGALAEIISLISNHPDINNSLKDKYSQIYEKVFDEIDNRIFQIFTAKEPCDWWENVAMNWCSVCSGNVGIAAYYMLKDIDDARYKYITDRVTKAMKIYISSMSKDGVCSEGLGYFKYGMEYYLKFLECIGRLDVINENKEVFLFPQRIYLGYGCSVNFSDCLIENKAKFGITSITAKVIDEVKIHRDMCRQSSDEEYELDFNPELVEIFGGDECHRWLGAYSDYKWVKDYGKYLKCDDSDMKNYVFPDSQWLVKDLKNGMKIYAKGGHNDESHNHNDVGSFALMYGGKEILCDLGSGEYTGDYFGDKRYEILCNSSKGHNVPILDGNYQKSGRDNKADLFDYKDEKLTISFGKAYGHYNLLRCIEFSDTGLTIADKAEELSEMTESFCLRIKPEIAGNKIFIPAGQETVTMTFDGGEININKCIHVNHSGIPEEVYLLTVKKYLDVAGTIEFLINIEIE